MPVIRQGFRAFLYLGAIGSGPSTCTEISSVLRREFWSDLTASSAVNLPIRRASLRLGVIWMGVRSIRRTYSVARVLPRFTFTTNFVFMDFITPQMLPDVEAVSAPCFAGTIVLFPGRCAYGCTEFNP